MRKVLFLLLATAMTVLGTAAPSTHAGTADATRVGPLLSSMHAGQTGALCSASDTVAANGVAVDAQGNVYVTQGGPYTSPGSVVIQRWSATGSLVGTWTTQGIAARPGRYPYGLAISRQGDIYLVDPATDRIRKFSSDGTLLAQWGRPGHADGQFATPVGVAVDRHGNVYVADRGNMRIQKLSATGKLLAVWGRRHAQNAPGLFAAPTSIAVDTRGRVYVADDYNRLVTLSPRGKALSVSDITKGSDLGEFRHPDGIAVDGAGNVYVGDKLNCRIQKLFADGRVQAWQLTPLDGGAASPTGLALDDQGNLYAVEVGAAIRVQRFSSTGRLLNEWQTG